MAVIAVAGAKGAPGASTAVLGMALAWSRPVILIEADPAGGSPILAGWLRGQQPNPGGLIDLALGVGLGDPVAAVLGTALQDLAPGVRFLPGPATPEQAAAAGEAWAPLGRHLRDLTDHDVLIDYGRPGPGAAGGLLAAADLVLMALRCDLPGTAAARAALPGLRGAAAAGGAPVEALLIDGTYSRREVAAALGVPAAAALPCNPAAAAALSHGAPRPRSWRRFEAALRRAAADVAAAAQRSPALQPEQERR